MRERRRDRLRLQHMLDACDAIMDFMSGRYEEDLVADKLLVSAVTRQIEIIGEAANMLTSELRTEASRSSLEADHRHAPQDDPAGQRYQGSG